MLILLLFFLSIFSFPISAAADIQITNYSVKTPEWIQIFNNSANSVDLTGWYFEDKDKNIKTIDGCISSNSTRVFAYGGFLNDTGDTLSLYDNSHNLIHELGVLTISSENQPTATSTCLIPTSTPIPTNIPPPTLTPSPAPTADPAVINPANGIALTEIMPYSNVEWIELYNHNDYDVKLVAWKIEDNAAHTKNISELKIKAKSYAVFEFALFLNNSDSDKLILYNQDQKIIDSYQYPAGKIDLEKSWSKNDNLWCLTFLSKEEANHQCFVPTPSLAPTSTITVTPTPVVQEDPSSESTSMITDSPPITPELTESPVSSNPGLVLGDSDTSSQRNFLPLILIFSGAILLLSPLIASKLKKP